MQLFKHLIII